MTDERPTYSPEILVGDVMILLNTMGLRGLYVHDQNAADRAAKALLEAIGVVPIDPPEEETS